jgi:anti-sigma B factor antagonist
MSNTFQRSEIELFRCDLEPRRDVVYVRPVGELDLASVPSVDAQLLELTSVGFMHLVLDLRGVSFLDSSGLQLILTWDAMARANGISFELIRGPAAVQRLFEVTFVADRLSFAAPDARPLSMAAER